MKVMRKILDLSIVFCLGLYLVAAPARADDAKDEVQEPAQAKKPGAVFKAPGSHTLDVALSPDGKIVARAGTGKIIELWDVASGKKLHTLKGQSNMWPPVFKVAFSPDGKTLASATESGQADKAVLEVKLWDVATGKERVPLKGHRSGVYSL